jgi:hypothetical protein
MEELRLRPHHILDIVRNIGHDLPLVPHEYGHLVHVVTRRIQEDVDAECRLVVANDDICGPCRMLKSDGSCADILPQLTEPVSKQAYNDALDRRLLSFLGIRENEVMTLRAYLAKVAQRIDEVVPLCTHPKEDPEYRRVGLIKGLERLHVLGASAAVTESI